jgi:hypothetical protein
VSALRWLTLLVVAWSSTAVAEPLRDEPWEPRPRSTRPASPPPPARRDTYRPLASAALSVVSLYRTAIGPGSIRRCPYAVSCSQYAALVLRRYGFAGVFFFMDRFYFRENHAAHRHYPLVRLPDETLRLDDGAPSLE